MGPRLSGRRRQETWREHRQAAPKQVGDPRQAQVSPRPAKARQQVEALPPKEKDAPPVSETDPEARLLKPGDGGFA
jgi:hypothetical protein